MFLIKCKDLVETSPAGFPAFRLSGRWEAFILRYPTFEEALEAVLRQKDRPKTRPVPERKWRIFEQEGRKLTLVWEG